MTSTRAAAAVVAMLLGLLLLSLFIPQRSNMTEQEYHRALEASPALQGADTLGLTDIRRSPVTLTFLCILVAGLLTSTGRRLGALPGQVRVPTHELPPGSLVGHPSLDLAEDPLDTLARNLERSGFKVHRSGHTVHGLRNGGSQVGSVLFHAALVLLVAAVTASLQTRFWGLALLAEGGSFTGTEYAVVEPKDTPIEDVPDVAFRLVEVTEERDDRDALTQVHARLMLRDGSSHDIAVNEPLRLPGGVSLRLQSMGFAPTFTIQDRESGQSFAANYMLSVEQPGSTDAFWMGELPYEFWIEFFPDYHEHEDGSEGTSSGFLKNPVATISAWAAPVDPETGQRPVLRSVLVNDVLTRDPALVKLGEARLRPDGEAQRLGPVLLAMDKVTPMARIDVDQDRSRPLIFAGMVLALAGMLWRLVLPVGRASALAEPLEGGGWRLTLQVIDDRAALSHGRLSDSLLYGLVPGGTARGDP